MDQKRINDLANKLCLLLKPANMGINERITKKVGWAKELYLGDYPENIVIRPKAAEANHAFMEKNSLSVESVCPILDKVEKEWKTTSVAQT